MAGEIKVGRHAISCDNRDGTFQPLASEESTLDGLNVHGAVVDELHAHKTPHVWDVLDSSRGARRQPMQLAITTAGEGSHGVCWDQRRYTELVLEGLDGFRDDSWFGFVSCADKDDDWRDPAVWEKANPNYGVSVKPSFLEDQATRAQGSPGAVNVFKRYYLNVWVDAAEGWMDMDRWRTCGLDYGREFLAGRACYAGVDLSRVLDLTALVWIFLPTSDDPYWRLWPEFWVPSDQAGERMKRDRVPYPQWAEEGRLELTPGAVVDYEYLTRAMRRGVEEFDVRQVGFDPWNATKWYTDLMQHEGYSDEFLVQVRQGPPSLSGGMKQFEALVYEGKLRHPNHPVLTWNVANTVAREDANQNVAPDKKKSTERIDGVSAIMTGMHLVVRQEGGATERVWDTEGLLVM